MPILAINACAVDLSLEARAYKLISVNSINIRAPTPEGMMAYWCTLYVYNSITGPAMGGFSSRVVQCDKL